MPAPYEHDTPMRIAGAEIMHRLTVPGIFWRDHYDRCGDEEGQRREVILDRGGALVIVELNDEALDDLRSDANHYGNGGLDFAGETAAYRSLIRSAQATLRAIDRQRSRS